ncbi:MFS transporter [Rhodopila sp.]|uniref:MFS transporter n=1 Tax=Rhodopila sp. TaxID=2480087 RepID=UPI003D0BD74F
MASISARLDRLPMTSAHSTAFIALAFAYFFELGDLNTFAYAAPAVIRQWGISVGTVALITSASFGGMTIGALAGGKLANAIGRRRGFILSTLLYGVFSLLNAAAWDVASLAVLRFITGIGLSAMTVIANTYISEFFPKHLRGRYMGLTMTVGLLGIPATAWVARLLVPVAPWGWRLIFVWGGLGIVAALVGRWMAESPRWLSVQGRTEEAEAEVVRLERLALDRYGSLAEPDQQADEPIRQRPPYATLFRSPYLGRTVVLTVISITGTVGFYGFMSWVPTLLFERGFSVVKSLTFVSVMAVCNPLGALLAADLMERFERKWFNTAVSLLVAVAGVAYGFSSDPTWIMVFGALVVISLQAGATGGYIYTSELYSTDVRSLGTGMTYGLGRLANVAGPFAVAAVYAGLGYEAVFGFVAGCYVLRGVAYAVYGPLTTGRSLEDVNAALMLRPRRAS